MSKLVLVTGANTGLGFEIVKSLFNSTKDTYTILLGGRSLEKAEKVTALIKNQQSSPDKSSKSSVEPVQIDVDDVSSIEKLQNNVKQRYGKLDVLIHNAGAVLDTTVDWSSLKEMQTMWLSSMRTNVIGSQLLTHAFGELLLSSKDARILFITTSMASLHQSNTDRSPHTPRPAAGWPKTKTGLDLPAYRSSKSAMNMMMLEWKRLFTNDANVKLFAINPGFLATNLGGVGPETLQSWGAIEPSIGGSLIRDVVEGKRDEDREEGIIQPEGICPW